MNQDRPNADNIRSLQDSQDGVTQQCTPEPLALIILVYRKPAQNDHGDRIRHVAPYATRRCFPCHGTGRQAVVPGDSHLIENDIGARCAALLVLQCAPA